LVTIKSVLVGMGLMLAVGFMAAASAQQSAKIPKIGYLSAGSATAGNQISTVRGLREGLKELGYVEGKNLVLELRFADGRTDRVPELVAELLSQKVDIVVSGGPAVTRAAKQATNSVPIVMAFDPDPVKAGFIVSLARPGGNITGNANMGAELIGKQMELLKLLLPRMSGIAVLGNSNEPANAQALAEAQSAARVLGLQMTPLDAYEAKSIDAVIEMAVQAKADAILTLASPVINRKRLLELTALHRMPAIYWSTDYVESGGLMAYTANPAELNRRIAVYVDKILKGRKPADLPVEQPTRYELVFNMKTAKTIGLSVPPGFLLRVDRLIE
jgi:putative ABC transport system substrate-binding protein